MIKKRVLSLLLTASLIFSGAGTALAADTADDTASAPSFTVGSETTQPGGEVSVPVTLSLNGTDIASIGLTVSYDEDAMELTEISKGSLEGTFMSNVSTGAVTLANGTNLEADGDLCTLEFTVKDDAAAGKYTVSVNYKNNDKGNICNADLKSVDCDFIDGTITVEIDQETCDHSYGEWETTKEATCTDKGEKTRTCSKCKKTETEEIAALGHSYDSEGTIKWADDNESATGEFTCKTCGDVTSVEATIKTEGDATCTEDGTRTTTATATLTVDGEEVATATDTKTETIKATGHKYEAEFSWLRGTDGYTATAAITCKNCDYSETVNADVVKDESKSTEATCTEDGKNVYTATAKAGDETFTDTREDTVAATGHQTEVKDAKDATCTEDGYTGDTVCTVCGETVEKGETIAATGHDWDEGVVTKEATETETGVKTYTCKNCGETKTEEIATLGHSWDEGKVTTEATCTTTGVKTYTCENCGETKTEEIAALGHSWDDGVVTKEATKTEDGVKTYTCKNCGETKTEVIPATGEDAHVHKTELKNAKDATCTEPGYTGDEVCTECGTVVKQGETIPAAHKTEIQNKKEATCTAEGYTGDEVCTVCKQTIKQGETIAKTEHTAKAVPAVAATYLKTGLTEGSVCSVCGTTLIEQEETATLSLSKVKNFKAKNVKTKKIKATWKKNKAADGYQIQYSTKKSFAKSARSNEWVKSYKTTEKTISSLKKNKTYYVRMRAYVVEDGTKVYSKWTTVKKVKIRK